MTTIPARSLLLRLSMSHRSLAPAAGLAGAALLLGSCSSVSRRPATGNDPVPAADTAPEPAPRTADRAPLSLPESDGLTDEEIRALPPSEVGETDILDIRTMSIEELNRANLLRDIRFDYDSARLSDEAQRTLAENADWLLDHPSVRILVEGHCDERGTVEYNLALGEERARAVRDYLGELGVAADRMRIISYGKEFPLDPAHTEAAWRQNRRAHLEVVAR